MSKVKVFFRSLAGGVEFRKIYLGEKSKVLVACGNNTVIELLSVQPSGKKVMSARDFANGALRKFL